MRRHLLSGLTYLAPGVFFGAIVVISLNRFDTDFANAILAMSFACLWLVFTLGALVRKLNDYSAHEEAVHALSLLIPDSGPYFEEQMVGVVRELAMHPGRYELLWPRLNRDQLTFLLTIGGKEVDRITSGMTPRDVVAHTLRERADELDRLNALGKQINGILASRHDKFVSSVAMGGAGEGH